MCDSEIGCVDGGGGPVQTVVPGQPVPVSPAPTSTNGIVEAINPAVQQMASSLSAHSMHHLQQATQQALAVHPSSTGAGPDTAAAAGAGGGGGEFVSAQELAMENHWLREKLKEITSDRDRLLCEVANLRLELDMAELKRLPEHR
ncbi:uncharacterized protein LOC118465354 isoform X3 [Anopheles albimanus]|uniref:Uncharacterized protein n=1 Tax=Anopheles albimanus TaxID=7167 RepID=A0A182FUV7_ANOAL|nr:uncharacterized protein LOC118465354 isoform X1 [Anopheles albimanus]XP_035789420.1 uncharacterized protein LOC118465354 isoform X2 [Anopheles albimanus]XP_035789421.1 uncharacterized protein LOC118465354 isoform X3 [Anopheles albimanus]